jgi:hypothetical protein
MLRFISLYAKEKEAEILMESAFSFYGAPGGSRTHDLWLRKPTLYPTELRALEADYIKAPCDCLFCMLMELSCWYNYSI